MSARTKKNKTSFRYDERYAELLEVALKERGGNLSEYIRLLMINDFIHLGIMLPMTDDEKKTMSKE